MTDEGVCVVTHPLGPSGENATRTLLDIVSAISPVALITADLPADSTIREAHDVVEVSPDGVEGGIVRAALAFVALQVRLCRALAGRDESTVVFFGATSYVLPIAFARLLGRRVFVEPRGDVPLTLRLQWETRVPDPVAAALAGLVRLLERTGFALADRVVTYTPGVAETLGLDPNDPDVYPHGARYVDVENFDVSTPLAEREIVVGFVGRVDEEKRVRELAEVASRLAGDVSFRFVGDGPLLTWLRSELDAEIAAGDVTVTGWVDHDDVPAELNRMRLVVLPSQPTEGLPTIILEALACGTPVLATPVSGVGDVVRDGETGFLLDDYSPDAIESSIRAIVEREDLTEVSANGRALVESEYSYDAAVSRYRELLVGDDGHSR